MLQRVAAIERRRLTIVPVPLLSPRLSSLWLNLVTDVDTTTARALVDSMTNEVVVRDPSIRTLVPFQTTSFNAAVRAALAERRKAGQAPIRRCRSHPGWIDAGAAADRPLTANSRVRQRRRLPTRTSRRRAAVATAFGVGGRRTPGWLAVSPAWFDGVLRPHGGRGRRLDGRRRALRRSPSGLGDIRTTRSRSGHHHGRDRRVRRFWRVLRPGSRRPPDTPARTGHQPGPGLRRARLDPPGVSHRGRQRRRRGDVLSRGAVVSRAAAGGRSSRRRWPIWRLRRPPATRPWCSRAAPPASSSVTSAGATGGILAPTVSHLTWSILMLRYLPTLFRQSAG